MNFGFQEAINFVQHLNKCFLVPKEIFRSAEEITLLFNNIVEKTTRDLNYSDNILSFFPVFYALKDINWTIDENPIFSSMEKHYFGSLFKIQDKLEKACGCSSISKSFLKLNGTKHNYCIKISCTKSETKVVKESPDIIAFYVQSDKRLHSFISDANFIEKYKNYQLFCDENISDEIKSDVFLYQFCQKIIPSITQHTVYLEQENDVLYYVFSASVIDYTNELKYGLGGLFIVLRNDSNFTQEGDFIDACRDVINRLSSCILLYYYVRLAQQKSLTSAIGSIMSRNGSHNIGSHVLSALSHNIGTMPDDRILYQYIQYRMDYIASATTAAPDWSVPTPFVANVMKLFYSQRHLLNHIAESDGLHAFQFQGKETRLGEEQINCIKLIVRKVERGDRSNDDGWQCLDGKISAYVFFENNKIEWKYDEILAIPGGVLGQQAFYNIVENIIRNAAKHSWTGKSDEDRKAVGNNLDIYIDFEKSEKDVCFTVGDNMSAIFVGKFWSDFFKNATIPEAYQNESLQEVFANPLDGFRISDSEDSNRKAIDSFLFGKNNIDSLPWFYQVLYDYVQSNWGKLKDDKDFKSLLKGQAPSNDSLGHRLPIPLHHRQELELAKPFIDLKNNRLRQASWGLSEMKISAGYLRRAKVSVIGGLAEGEKGEHPLIVPVGVPPKGEKTLDYRKLHLGYRFWIKIPLRVLIVTDDISKWKDSVNGKDGVDVKDYSEVLGDRQIKGDIGLMSDYEFVLIDHDDKIQDKERLPFRALKICDSDCELPYILRKDLDDARKDKEEFISVVYKAWVNYLKRCRMVDVNKSLTIKLNIYNDDGSARGLIRDLDIYKVLFKECLHSILEPFADDDKFSKLDREAILLLSLYPVDEKSNDLFDDVREVNPNHRWLIEGLLVKISVKILKFLEAFPCAAQKDCDKLTLLINSYQKGLENAKNSMNDQEIPLALLQLFNKVQNGESCNEYSNLKKLFSNISDNPEDHNILKLAVDALYAARTTSDVFLRKYEEKIVTLPSQYQVLNNVNNCILNFSEKIGVIIDYNSNSVDADISYNRHDIDSAKLYSEPLSGSQSYLNALANLSQNDEQWAMRLAENALLRIVIIDERVCSFVLGHGGEIKKTYESMHISVVDTRQKQDISDWEELKYVAGGDIEKNFDVVVIHQGIIDKWWDSHGKNEVSQILNKLRKRQDFSVGRFVVVTTGRGRPDNIPDNEKVLAFSSIEAFLFRRYPEKLNLVNSLMNILPGSPERSNDDD